MDLLFIAQNAMLGIGLAMDAFSVSLANGLSEPCMKKKKMGLIALIFAFFQGAMPLIGWVCVHFFVEAFQSFKPFIPWIALVLLCFIGGKMLKDGLSDCSDCECGCTKITLSSLLVQGIATSIDALSVGFTIAEYGFGDALAAVGIIAALTFTICFGGVYLGKKFGTKLSGKATILGGVILILIGIEIVISSFL